MNAIFSIIFLADFTYRIFTAPSALAYFFRHFGWADLLASLPFAQFKILRVFRLVRVYRLLREVGIRTIGRTLLQDRAGSALYVLLLMGILVLAVRQPHDARHRAERPGREHHDRLGRPLVHDRHDLDRRLRRPLPGHRLGRLCGVVIIVVGVGIFGTFTGYLANVFLGPNDAAKDEDKDEDEDAAADVTGEPEHTVPAADAAPARPSRNCASDSKSPRRSSQRSAACWSSQFVRSRRREREGDRGGTAAAAPGT